MWSWNLIRFYTSLYLMSQQGKILYVISVFSCFDFHRFYLRDIIFKNLNELYEFNYPRWPSGLRHFVCLWVSLNGVVQKKFCVNFLLYILKQRFAHRPKTSEENRNLALFCYADNSVSRLKRPVERSDGRGKIKLEFTTIYFALPMSIHQTSLQSLYSWNIGK